MNKAANELLNLAFELEEWFDLFGARFKIHDYAGLTRCAEIGGRDAFLAQFEFLFAQQSVKFPRHLVAPLLKVLDVPETRLCLAGKPAPLAA